MSKRSDKMYAKSPTLERGEDGKMGVSKKEKKAAEVNSGTDGIPEHESHAMAMAHKHEKERLELHQKHEREHHELMSKHIKEGPKVDLHAEKEETAAEKKEEPSRAHKEDKKAE